MKKLLIIALSILLILSVSCASNKKESKTDIASEEYGNAEVQYDKAEAKRSVENPKENVMMADKGKTAKVAGKSAPNLDEEKLVKNLSINMNTMKFEEDRNALDELLFKYNAIISNSSVNISEMDKKRNKRRLFYNIRIDGKKLDEFKKEVESKFNVVFISESKTNITQAYQDTQGRLKNLEIQRDRIREILKKAEKINDIIQLERRLSELDFQIESYTNNINRMDTDVKYSFVNLELREVKDPAKLTKEDDSSFGVRIKNAFVSGFKGFVKVIEELIIFVISALPVLIILGVIAFFVIRYMKKKKKE